ncbi:MAG: hypothetical protein ACLQVD_11990 [Capsulimonadaceae bacterium]
MAKPSGPALYAVIGVVAVGACWLYVNSDNGPTTPAHRHVPVSRTGASTAAPEYTADDYKAKFPRYAGKRDPFIPKVVSDNGQDGAAARGGWALTGITAINGEQTALVENSGTGDSVFLKPGDHWNGKRVTAVGADYVALENAFGQDTRMAFPVNDVTTEPSQGAGEGMAPLPVTAVQPLAGGTVMVPAAPPLPTLANVTPDVPATNNTGGFRGRRFRQGNTSDQ